MFSSADDELKCIGAAAWNALITGDRMFSDDFYDVGLGAALETTRLGAYRDICAAFNISGAAAEHIAIIVMAYRGVDPLDLRHVIKCGTIRGDRIPYCSDIKSVKKKIMFTRRFFHIANERGSADLIAYYMIEQYNDQYDPRRGQILNGDIGYVGDAVMAAAITIAAAVGGDCKNIFDHIANMQWDRKTRHPHIGPKTAAAFATWITTPPAMDIKFYKRSIISMWAGSGNDYYKKHRGADTGPDTFLGTLSRATAAIDPRFSVEFAFGCDGCWASIAEDCDCDEDGHIERYGVCEECSVYSMLCKCDECFDCCGCYDSCKCDE